jgi:hypothetical protein
MLTHTGAFLENDWLRVRTDRTKPSRGQATQNYFLKTLTLGFGLSEMQLLLVILQSKVSYQFFTHEMAESVL